MAYGAKDYIVLCLDVGPSMNIAPPSGGDTHLEMALRVANQIVKQKMFAGSKDFVGLVLFGTTDTDNDLAADGGYDNITVAYQPAQPTLDFLKYIHNQIEPGETSADFIDALVVSMDCLVKATTSAKRVGEKKIYLLTDAGSEYSDDSLDLICSGLKKSDIELVIVGPNLDTSGADGGDSGGGGGGDSPGGDGPGPSHRRQPPPSSSVMKKTAQQIAGEAVLSRVLEEVEGVNFSFSEALQVATFIRKNAKKQTTRFAGCLEIGSKMKIPIKIYTKTMEERPATWKKLSAISQASANPGSMAVKMYRSYHCKDEDETEVEPENVVKGYRYGKSLIPISDADEGAMKLLTERGLSLLGFTSMGNIKWHQILGNSVQCIVADPSKQEAGQLLSAFIHGMYETNTVAVLRYVWRKNTQPKLMAAIPKIKADRECLYMFQLPFMEDTRQYVFNPLPGNNKSFQPSDEQKAAMESFISNMDLMTADVDEDGEPCEALKPSRTCNPVMQRTFQCISHRALNPDEPLPDVDPNIIKMLGPSEALLDKCKDDIQRIKGAFPLHKVEKKKDDDGGATEAWKKTSELDLDAEAPPSKRPRIEDESTDFSMASLARGEITQVGTLDPVGDYRNLIGRKDVDKFDDASKQMQEVTLRLVKESFGDTYYDKAMDCVKALRSEAVRHSESEMFNKFLRDMKTDFIGTRYSAFWDKVANESVSLITSSESEDSSVTQDEAKQFLEAPMEEVEESTPPPPDETDDADDLLAMM